MTGPRSTATQRQRSSHWGIGHLSFIRHSGFVISLPVLKKSPIGINYLFRIDLLSRGAGQLVIALWERIELRKLLFRSE